MTIESISIQFMSGPQDGLQLTLDVPATGGEASWLIGRSDDCDVVLSYDTQVSRTHAQLVCVVNNETVAEAESDAVVYLHYRLVDVGSRNGTYVHYRRLKNESIDIEPGQLFRVGRTWMRIDP